MVRLALASLFILPGAAYAQDRQYRELELTDGRTFRAEILATESTGLRMRIPQGETVVSFEVLVNIRPVTEAEYDAQEPVMVWIHAPDHLQELAAVYRSIPNTIVASASDSAGLPHGMAYELGECGPDFSCMARAIDNDRFVWLVSALEPTDESSAALVLRSRSSGGPPIERVDLDEISASALWEGGHAAIGLLPDGNAPRSVKDALGGDAGTDTSRPPRASGGGGGKKVVGMLIGGLVGGGVLGATSYVAVGGLEQCDPGFDACNQKSGAAIGVTSGLGAVVGGLVGWGLGGEPAAQTVAGGGFRFRIDGRF